MFKEVSLFAQKFCPKLKLTFIKGVLHIYLDGDLVFHDCLAGKESACNAWDTGDAGSIPRSGKSPGEGNGNQLSYSCWKNSTDRGAWKATVHGIAESVTTDAHMHAWLLFVVLLIWNYCWISQKNSTWSGFDFYTVPYFCLAFSICLYAWDWYATLS